MRLRWTKRHEGNKHDWMISLMQQKLAQGTLALVLVLALTLDNVAGISPAATSHFSAANTEVVGFPASSHHSSSEGGGSNAAVIAESSQDGATEGLDRQRRSAAMTPLGKRITSNLVAELGKRPRELYSFGIGKRSISAQEMAEFLAEEEAKEKAAAAAVGKNGMPRGSEDGHHDMAVELEDPDHAAFKRGPMDNAYAFGVGKREYKFGMGRKRDPYAFGLGKRDPYSFGLGKRDPYAFGLGKRDPYAFGLGKRNPYSFGLGKRDPYSFGLGKRDPYSFGLGKRSDH